MSARRSGKGLRGNYHPDPEHNGHASFQGNDLADNTRRPGQADQHKEDSIQSGIPGTRPHFFPARMSNINGCGKATAQ